MSGIIYAENVLTEINNNDFETLTRNNNIRLKREGAGDVKELLTRVKNLNLIREAGNNLANEIYAMNQKLFNDYEYIIPENISVNPPEIRVRAIMLAGKNQRAMIDTENIKGLIVKPGEKISGGRILRIRSDGIILKINNVEVFYPAN